MAACDAATAVYHYRSGPLKALSPGTVSVRSNRNPTRAEVPKLRTVVDDSYVSLRNPHSVVSQLAFFQDRGKCARGCTCASHSACSMMVSFLSTSKGRGSPFVCLRGQYRPARPWAGPHGLPHERPTGYHRRLAGDRQPRGRLLRVRQAEGERPLGGGGDVGRPAPDHRRGGTWYQW
jgi:hypothetical protein